MVPLRIGVLRTDRLGDMVLTLPMMNAIREVIPGAHCTLFTRAYVRPLLLENPAADTVVYVDENTRPLHHLLRDEHLDVLFFPRPRAREAWDALRAAIPQRVGSAYRWYAPLFTTTVKDHRSKAEYHEAEYNMRMIARAFNVETPMVRLVHPRPHAVRDAATVRIVIHPGSGGSAPEWPAECFGEVAAYCAAELGAQVLITGLEQEKEKCRVVAERCSQAQNLCGALDLGQMIDLISTASLLCANSTGVLHVAAACGTPVVGFYPHTPSMSKHRWGPYTTNALVLESTPDNNMRSIEVSAAINAVRQLLQT